MLCGQVLALRWVIMDKQSSHGSCSFMQTRVEMSAVVKCSNEQKHTPPLRFSFSLFLRVSSGWETKQDKELWKNIGCLVCLNSSLIKTTQLNSVYKWMWHQALGMLSSKACDGKSLSHLGLWDLRRWRLWICSLTHHAISASLRLYPPAASSARPTPPVRRRKTLSIRTLPPTPSLPTNPSQYKGFIHTHLLWMVTCEVSTSV